MSVITHLRRILPSALALTLLVFTLVGCGGEPPATEAPADETPATPTVDAFAFELPEAADAAAEAITADALRTLIGALSEDRLEGRGPGSEGDRLAREILIEELQGLGLQPGGPDGSWEQTFQIIGIDADVPDTWTFDAAGKTLDLKFWDEFIASSGVQRETATVEDAEVVFVGYGIEAPEYQWDDFGEADLNGKVLLMLNNDPDWDPELFEGDRRLYYGRWTYKYESAARQGAVGAIIIHTDASAGYPFQVVQTSWTGPQFELPAGDEPRLEVAAWTSYEAAERLTELAGHDLGQLIESARSRDFQPVDLGVRTSISLTNELAQDTTTANVLALLPGSDPTLAEQAVIYTAHHDHLGRGAADADGDEIYNGARDNASGTAMIVEIARAFQALPEAPKRSILFAFVGAEEQGLLGSKFFAQHPTIHPGQLVANVNFDSGNIWGRTGDISYIGYGKSNLDDVAEAAAAKQGRIVKGDQFPDRGLFYRSDQFSLAKIGVPAMYLSGGTDYLDDPDGKSKAEAWVQNNYHQQSDELDDSWNLDGMVEDARVGFWAGLAIADSAQLPEWNPGDEFEAARKAARAELGDQ